VLGVALPEPFQVMSYEDAMRDYGVDKPDLRVPLKLTELTDVMKDVDFKVFRDRPMPRAAVSRRCACRGELRFRARRSTTTRNTCAASAPRDWPGSRSTRSAKGGRGPAVPDREEHPCARAGGDPRTHRRQGWRPHFLRRDKAAACNAHLGALRQKVGHDRGLAEKGWRPLWVVDFPMFEYDEESKEWKARHHPFTSPKDGHEAFIETDQAKAYAKAYDMVLNGWEIAGGSVRIHRQEVQQQVFRALKISPEDQQAKFGFLLQALQYGAPAARRYRVWF
jgi:aspartyl-tRNA synthetase